MTHFFDRRDYWGNRFSVWVVVCMAFVAPLCWWSLRQTRFDDSLDNRILDNNPEVLADRWVREQFSVEDRILLTWDDSSINDPRIGMLVEQLSGRLDEQGIKRGGIPYVSSVVEPVRELKLLQSNGIEPHEAVRRLEGTILGVGPLRLRLTETGRSAMRKTKREIQLAIEAKYGLAATVLDAPPDLSSLTSIPAPITNAETAKEPCPPAILSANGQLIAEAKFDHDLIVTWKGLRIGGKTTMEVADWLTKYIPERGAGEPLVETTFFAPGSPIALLIGVSEAGLADKAETLTAIRSACNQVGIPSESLHLSGPVVAAAELQHQVWNAIWDTSAPLIQIHRRSVLLASTLLCALLVYGLLRNVRLATMVISISLFAVTCAMAILPQIGGSMHGMLIVLPTLLLVSALSGAIQLANYWRHRAQHKTTLTLGETFQAAFAPCLFASLAVAIGYVSLSTGKLVSVREFAMYAILGTLTSFVVLMFGLPSLIQLGIGDSLAKVESGSTGWRTFGQFLSVRPGLQSYALIAIFVGCGMGLNKLQVDSRFIQPFGDDSKLARDNWFFETNLTGVTPLETIIRFDQQSQKDTNFLDRMELVRKVEEQIRQHVEISGTTSLADFQPVSELAPADASFLLKSRFNKKASAIEQRFRDREFPDARSYYSVSEAASRADKTGNGQFSKHGDELWRISTAVMVMTDSNLDGLLTDMNRITQDVLKMQPGSHHFIAGSIPVFISSQAAMKQLLPGSYRVALALIFVMLVVSMRSFGAAVLALIPNVAPMAVVLGIFSWTRQPIDLGSLIAAPITMGIAVGGTLHYLTLVRIALKQGKTRHDAMVDALMDCGPAILHATTVVALGSLILSYSDLPLISRFGLAMASMSGVALVSNIVLLPLLVAGPLGWLFESAKPQVAAPAIMDEPLPNVENAQIAPAIQDTPLPEPHIASHNPTSKKRRSSSRRDRDAG
jgi:predicted RND superfamily exporter protein